MFNNKEQDEFTPLIDDCKHLGIKILPPDINASYYEFTLEGKSIRFGLKGIKGVGEADGDTLNRIIDERKNGAYENFQDFLLRNIFQNKIVPKGLLLNLIQCGTFDSFFEDRQSMETVMSKWENKTDESLNSLHARITNIPYEDYGKDSAYNRKQEMQLLGSIISEDPLKDYQEDDKYGCIPLSEISEMEENGTIFGLLIQIEDKISKKGNKMSVFTIQGKTGTCTAYMMDKKAQKYHLKNFENQVVKITGSIKKGSVFVNTIEPMSPEIEVYSLILHNSAEIRIATEIMNSRPMNGFLNLMILHPVRKNGNIYPQVSPKKYPVKKETIFKLIDAGLTVKSGDAYHLLRK